MRRMFSLEQLKGIASDQVKSVKKDISTLVDADGHDRFIEGEITIGEIAGLSISFAKWSLSGTHLMIVIAGEFAENSSFSAGTVIGYCMLPQWITDKIYPVISTYVDSKNVLFRDELWATQEISTTLIKELGQLRVYLNSTATISSDKGFRIDYDLLID